MRASLCTLSAIAAFSLLGCGGGIDPAIPAEAPVDVAVSVERLGQLSPPKITEFVHPYLVRDRSCSGTFSVKLSDGPVTSYQWNFGGAATPNTSTQATPTVVLGAPGNYTISVRVSNAAGSDSRSFPFRVDDIGWYTESKETSGSRGRHTSIAMSASGLMLACSQSAASAAVRFYPPSGAIHNIDSVASTTPSLAIQSNGRPVIAYQTRANGTLVVARGTVSVPTSTAQWTRTTVEDLTTKVGESPSLLALPDGRLAITHYDSDNGDLRFALQNGAGWTRYAIDTAGIVGSISSLSTYGSGLAVAYYDVTHRTLKLARATTTFPASAAAWTISTIDSSSSDMGFGVSTHNFGSTFGIAYYDLGSIGRVKFASTSIAGAPVWNISVAASIGLPSSTQRPTLRTSLTSFQNRPAIAYFQPNGADARLAVANTTPGATMSWQTMLVESTGSVGSFCDVAMLDSCPTPTEFKCTHPYLAVSYFNETAIDPQVSKMFTLW